jgi:glycosyltransferase involved in cell wall biosynthesis
MAKISACIISFNEEKKIEDCLKSLQSVADEIIVIDSNSTDNTVNIARKYTDKIYTQAFLGYGKQKNLATSKANYNWIINLDCDERLSEELQQSILDIKTSLNDTDGWYMTRRTFYIYRWLNHCWYPDKKLRLFNKNKTRWNDADVHESINTEGMRCKTLKGDIFHYSFDSISDHLKTIDKFTETGANDLIRKNKRITVLSPFTHASWTFIRIYFIRLGFLDGFAGALVATLSYMHVFTKYSKALIKKKQNSEK